MSVHDAPSRQKHATRSVFPKLLRTCCALVLMAVANAASSAVDVYTQPPVAPVRPFADNLYGIKVVDPYRYMEKLKDPAVKKWFKQEDAYARDVLGSIPGRKQLLTDIEKYDNSNTVQIENLTVLPPDLFFYEKLKRGEQVPRLYVRRGLSGMGRLLLDPVRYEKKGGPQWAITYYSPSPDGRHVAVGVSPGGSEQPVLHVIDVATGRETGGTVHEARAVVWRDDGQSFFYNRLRKLPAGAPPSAKYLKSHVYLHRLGTDFSQDPVIFGHDVSSRVAVRPVDFPVIELAPGSHYVVGLLVHGVSRKLSLYVAPRDTVSTKHIPWKKVADAKDEIAEYYIHGDDMYLLSRHGAPRGKILHVDLRHPDMAQAQVVLPQRQGKLNMLGTASDALYVRETNGMISHLLRLPYDGGQPVNIALPYPGTLGSIEGNGGVTATDDRLPGIVFSMTSWARAPQLFAYTPSTGKVTNTHLQPMGPFDKADNLMNREVMAKSYDGTMVPLSIVYRKGTRLDGSNPVALLGYGAYGMTRYPAYMPVMRAWYDRGGILAVAHVRGGGVYGEKWHLAGKKLTKPNTWRDLIACAHYLTDHKYTSPKRLVIIGGSAGGITVGRAMTEQPGMFAAVIDNVGLSNPLRNEFTSNGPGNVPEFGSIKSQAGFEDLYAMDSYQHVRDGVKYPAVLLTTGWNDPRVAPWQAGKMTARLQAATSSGKPVLLRVHYNAGHGYGSTRHQHETQAADSMSFALWQMGIPGFQPMHSVSSAVARLQTRPTRRRRE
jgi:prolyl oligopeptidase